MHTACLWSEKLPFAGYSVEKELLQSGLCPEPRLGRSWGPKAPLRSLAGALCTPWGHRHSSSSCDEIAVKDPARLSAAAILYRAGVSGVPARPARLNVAP